MDAGKLVAIESRPLLTSATSVIATINRMQAGAAPTTEAAAAAINGKLQKIAVAAPLPLAESAAGSRERDCSGLSLS